MCPVGLQRIALTAESFPVSSAALTERNSFTPFADEFGDAVQALDEPFGFLAREIRREEQLPLVHPPADDGRGNPSMLPVVGLDGHAPSVVSAGVLFQQNGAL